MCPQQVPRPIKCSLVQKWSPPPARARARCDARSTPASGAQGHSICCGGCRAGRAARRGSRRHQKHVPARVALVKIHIPLVDHAPFPATTPQKRRRLFTREPRVTCLPPAGRPTPSQRCTRVPCLSNRLFPKQICLKETSKILWREMNLGK